MNDGKNTTPEWLEIYHELFTRRAGFYFGLLLGSLLMKYFGLAC